MKTLRNVIVCALACAAISAAPAGVEPGASSASAAPAQPALKPGEPKWVESMQRLVKELTDDNLKLQRQVADLRDQAAFLDRQLADCRTLLEKEKANRGVLVIPPGAAQPNLQRVPNANSVPKNWQPFEFNGVTYYKIPLVDPGQQALPADQIRPVNRGEATIATPRAKE